MSELKERMIEEFEESYEINARRNKIMTEVECPYCYATYDIKTLEDMQFECVCGSTLQVEFDEYEEPYIESY